MERALGTTRERAPRLNSAQAARIIADLAARVSALEARWAQLAARMIRKQGRRRHGVARGGATPPFQDDPPPTLAR